jgi:hypothetical protein
MRSSRIRARRMHRSTRSAGAAAANAMSYASSSAFQDWR